MSNDASRMQNDLQTIITTMSPELQPQKLSIRLEEVLYRYNIEHKATADLENDLSDKIYLYLSAKEVDGLSPVTLEDYESELGLFARFTKKAVIQIQTPDIRAYLASLTKVKSSTLSKKLSVLKTFFSWLVQEEILLKNPTSKVKLTQKRNRIPKSLTVQELELVREVCETQRQRAFVEVFYSTGCRLSEVANMDIDDIDMQDMSARIIGKGNKERRVYFSFTALYHLNRYLDSRNDDCPSVFVTERRPYRRMHKHSIEDEIHKIQRLAGFTKSMTPHTFRHTLAQNMLNNGAALEEVQHVLGHSEISTTQVYTHISEERKRSAHKRFS